MWRNKNDNGGGGAGCIISGIGAEGCWDDDKRSQVNDQ